MSRNKKDLIAEVSDKVVRVEEICLKQGLDILVYCTERTLQEQAILYRKTRTKFEIDSKINSLNNAGFDFLANIIKNVGPQKGILGRHVTFAGPGESWHNYKEAFDAVPILNGKCCWSKKQFIDEWEIYGQAVVKSGMIWAGNWNKFKEFPHAQLRAGSNPLRNPDRSYMRPQKIKQLLLKK